MTEDGSKALIKAQWPSLSCLNLQDNGLGTEFLRVLSLHYWKNLTFLLIDGAKG